MRRSDLPSLVVCALAACRSAPAGRSDAGEPQRSYAFLQRISTEDVPQDAGQVELEAPLPVDSDAQKVRLLQAACLVGNASFEIPIETGPGGASRDPRGVPVACAAVEVVGRVGDPERLLVIETQGEPVELELRFELELPASAGEPGLAELERSLAPRSRVDGTPCAVASSLRRVR